MTAVPGSAVAIGASRGGRVRGALRLAAIPLVTFGCWIAWLAAGFGQGGARRRAGMVSRWARYILRVLHLEVVQSGRPPDRPFLLVANHLSYLDVVVLMTRVDAVFIAKREVRDWPIFGALAGLVGTVFIDRESARDTLRVGTEISRALAGGRGVVLFAEGTSSDGTQVLPLRPALLDGAARGAWPVHVASLSYHTSDDDPPAGTSLCWWGDMRFLPHLAGVCRLRGGRARVHFAKQPVVAPNRRALASELHRALSHSFIPTSHGH